MLTRVFDRVYTIKPEYDKKEFTRRIVLKLLEDDNLPADIFDIEFGEVQLNYDNVIAVADCKIHTKYDGSIGYERKEDYWDKEQKRDSNGKIYYVDVKKTRTITDWHPYSGESDSTDKVYVDGISATIGCFSEGLSRFNDSRFKCEKLFKQIDESLIVEEGAADLEDKFFVAFRRLCEYDVHVYYDRALPGDRKELRYDSDIEFENIVCYIIPTYSVKYIYKGVEYECSNLSVDLNDIYIQKPENVITMSDINDDSLIEAVIETKEQKIAVYSSWVLSWFSILLSIIFCFIGFHYGWIITLVLLGVSILSNIKYDKKIKELLTKKVNNYKYELRREKLEKLNNFIDKNNLRSLKTKELNSFNVDEETIQGEYVYCSRDSKVKLFTIITSICLGILMIFSFTHLDKYNHLSKHVNIECTNITGEVVDNILTPIYTINLEYQVISNKEDIMEVYFELRVFDKNGKELGVLNNKITNAELVAKEEKKFTCIWEGTGSFIENMYNAKFEDLTFEYKITSIRFEDYELIDYEEN